MILIQREGGGDGERGSRDICKSIVKFDPCSIGALTKVTTLYLSSVSHNSRLC